MVGAHHSHRHTSVHSRQHEVWIKAPQLFLKEELPKTLRPEGWKVLNWLRPSSDEVSGPSFHRISECENNQESGNCKRLASEFGYPKYLIRICAVEQR